MRTHRCHTRTAADKDHFRVGVFGKEFAERAGNRHFVARLEGPDIGRHDARGCIRHIRRRRGDTHVEHNNALLFRIVSHGISAKRGLFYFGNKAEEVKFIPVGPVLLGHVEVSIRHGVCRTINLDIPTRTERDALPFRNVQLELFNERGFVIVRDNFALPFFHAEDLLRQLNLHVLAHSDLTRQTAALFRFTLRDMRQFCWQNITASLFHRHTALSTGATAATGRRDKNPVAGERVKQLIPCRGTDLILRIVIDINDHIPGIHQLRTRCQDQP